MRKERGKFLEEKNFPGTEFFYIGKKSLKKPNVFYKIIGIYQEKQKVHKKETLGKLSKSYIKNCANNLHPQN